MPARDFKLSLKRDICYQKLPGDKYSQSVFFYVESLTTSGIVRLSSVLFLMINSRFLQYFSAGTLAP